MNQKSSLLNYQAFVSRALVADSRTSPATADARHRLYAVANQAKEVAPSLLASDPAMIFNHKNQLRRIPSRVRLALTDSKR